MKRGGAKADWGLRIILQTNRPATHELRNFQIYGRRSYLTPFPLSNPSFPRRSGVRRKPEEQVVEVGGEAVEKVEGGINADPPAFPVGGSSLPFVGPHGGSGVLGVSGGSGGSGGPGVSGGSGGSSGSGVHNSSPSSSSHATGAAAAAVPKPPDGGKKEAVPEDMEWVQCEKCEKWRRLPPNLSAADLPDVWYCSMNTWDRSTAR